MMTSPRAPIRSVASITREYTISGRTICRSKIRRHAEQTPDARDGGIGVPARVLGQQLADGERVIRAARDQVGERAATVDPELPAAVHACLPSPTVRS